MVDQAFDVTAYRTLWFGLQYDSELIESSPCVGHGALRTVRWDEGEPVGDGYTRGALAGTKRVVGDMVDRGVFGRDGALASLAETVRAETCPHAEVRISRAD